MHPRDFHEAHCAIRIFEDYGMTVENKLGHWTVHYSDGSMHGQFYDSHSMYCAAVGFKEGVSHATIRANTGEFVGADEIAEEIGDIFVNSLYSAPIQQWSIVSSLLEEHGYKIVRKK